ncbi:protealysin inhibitor emfourin [Krasilnikovia sp. MM14-A1259]|uniref:protealysin inhibitor emfourin n=1 Tax=Krasilnikovia sp. MM14-A1259 TaxID=3373539 RepID=UPI003825D06D
MKIALERSGGFAAVPALSGDIVVDTDEVSREMASELERLVDAVQFADRPRRTHGAAGAADVRTYRLTVDRQRRSDVLAFTDLTRDSALDALVTRLEAIARGR